MFVSLCVTRTAFKFLCLFNACSKTSGFIDVPGSKLSISTSAPNLFAISPKRFPNDPIDAQITLSPTDNVLAIAASIAPVPDEDNINISFFVEKTNFNLSVTL